MIAYKVKRKGYIADLYLPEETGDRMVILIPGLPKSSNVEKLVATFVKSGYCVLYPNFSGSYDSNGSFSGEQCINDVKEFIKWSQQRRVKEIYFGNTIDLGQKKKNIILAGMSFGALPSLLSESKKIKKLLLLSPALIYRQSDINKIRAFDFSSQMTFLVNLLRRAYPHTYRVKSYVSLKKYLHGSDEKLSISGILHQLSMIRIPTLVIHGRKDSSVPWQISDYLRENIKNQNVDWFFSEVGHSNSSYNTETLKRIKAFLGK